MIDCDLNKFIQTNYNFSQEDILTLQNIIQKYPWFQLAYQFLAKANNQNATLDYTKSLNSAAFYSNDSEVLFDYIYKEKELTENQFLKSIERPIEIKIDETEIKEENFSTEKQKETKKNNKEDFEKDNDIEVQPINEIKIEDELIAEKEFQNIVENKVIEDINIDLKLPIAEEVKSQSLEKNPEISFEGKHLAIEEQSEILDKFIQNEPSINKPADGPYDETLRLAKESLEDRFEVVSETLAEIYFKQDNPKKAIKIYKQLMLKVPEKKRYFAARIKEIVDNT